MADSLVTLAREGHVAVVTLTRTAKLNSLTPAMLDELERIARALEADQDVRVVADRFGREGLLRRRQIGRAHV